MGIVLNTISVQLYQIKTRSKRLGNVRLMLMLILSRWPLAIGHFQK